MSFQYNEISMNNLTSDHAKTVKTKLERELINYKLLCMVGNSCQFSLKSQSLKFIKIKRNRITLNNDVVSCLEATLLYGMGDFFS